MTRKRIKHEQVPIESKRNTIFRKRVDSLLKKAKELSILCGIDMGIVVHKQGQGNNIVLWPSPEIFGDRLHKFLNFPTMERSRKMVTHNKYMEQIVSGETKDFLKSQKMIELKELQQLMNEVMQGKSFDELNMYELNGLNSFVDEMILTKLQKRDKELSDEQGLGQPLPQLPYGMSMMASNKQMVDETSHALDRRGVRTEMSFSNFPIRRAMNNPLPPNNDLAP